MINSKLLQHFPSEHMQAMAMNGKQMFATMIGNNATMNGKYLDYCAHRFLSYKRSL